MKKTKKIKLFANINMPILILMLLYSIIGAFLILDASSISSVLTYGVDTYYFFQRQLIFIGASLVASLFILRFSTKTYRKLSGLLSITFLGLTFAVYMRNKLFSTGVNEVSLNLFGFNFQPAEFLKIFVVMYMASYYDDWVNKSNRKKWGFITPLLLCGACCIMILFGGDFGSAALMVALFALVFMAVPCQEKIVVIFKRIALGGLIFCILALKFAYLVVPQRILESDYRLNRFIYVDACDRYEENSGYQVCNGYIAINNGGLTGVGLGNSTQKYLYLPEPYTDFIFAIIVEELGLVVGIGIILLFMFVLYIIFRVATSSRKLQNSLICYGVGIYLLLHIFINLGGVLGLIPLTGVPLPFLSYGGSFCVTVICSLAVVQRINIENKFYSALAKDNEKLKN